MLDLYKLEIFALVSERGSFSAAAEQLLMTQSGVSQHIQDLEASLGAQLFARGRRGVQLTASGETLYRYTRQIFALVAEAENAVTDVAQLASGQVQIGATPGVSVYLLADWVQSFRARYPKLTVNVETSITPQIIKDLLSGRLDIGLIEGELAADADQYLGIHLLEEIEQFVVVGKNHPFWSRTTVAIQELGGQAMIMRQRNSQTRNWLEEVLRQQQVQPRVTAEFDTIESMKRAVVVGNALTILPDYAIRTEEAFGILRPVPIEGKPLVRTVKLIWDKQRFFTPAIHSFLNHLQSCFPALAGLAALRVGK